MSYSKEFILIYSFADNYFDFIFQRMLGSAFTKKQWVEIIIPELVRVTKPGGWMEFHEAAIGLESQGPVTTRLSTAGKFKIIIVKIPTYKLYIKFRRLQF